MPAHVLTVKTKPTSGFKVYVNFRPVRLQKGSGRCEVEEATRTNLFWQFIGKPGQEYQIELVPATGMLKMGGDHPVKLKVSQDTTMSGGHRYFKINPSEK